MEKYLSFNFHMKKYLTYKKAHHIEFIKIFVRMEMYRSFLYKEIDEKKFWSTREYKIDEFLYKIK